MTRSTHNVSRWLLAGIALFLVHGTAFAQATRTWVSGVGNDANPCSRTAPCKTFAGAYSKTAAGGEIDVLDPGGFGAVTIGKALTINGYGEGGGILNSLSNGIIVNAGATDVVVIRHVMIQGAGAGATSGVNGIKILKAGAVHLEDVTISAQNAATPNGYGVWINPTVAGNLQVFMSRVRIVDCGIGTTGGGIYVQPIPPATATLQITDSQIANNQGFAGIRVDSGGFANIRNSSITGNWGHGAVTVSTVNPADIAVHGSMVSGNGVDPGGSGAGLQAQGSAASVRVKDSIVTDNEVGIRFLASGILTSYGDNMIYGNTTDGTASSTIGGL